LDKMQRNSASHHLKEITRFALWRYTNQGIGQW
jgi:hypothetical protein